MISMISSVGSEYADESWVAVIALERLKKGKHQYPTIWNY